MPMTIIKPTTSVSSVAVPPPAEITALTIYLEQAEVCREQAREAARLKRFRSALGLFSTASALCRHVSLHGSEAERALASEFLSALAIEMATYNDLARGARRSAR
ncbi:hypothetical protein IAD21_04340 [Abditibacteriota bacterium]|nr:hypothetical protein IAD21_04340 [Abditibacteriota bacterium]